MKKTLAFIACLAFVLLSFLGSAFAAEPIDAIKANIKKQVAVVSESVPSITVQELKTIIEKDKEFFEILDVRERDEYDAGRLGGAVWVPRGKAEWMVPIKIKDPDVPIYVYCKAGSRGALVTRMLIDAGYTRVTNITGGFKAWASAGYPFYNLHGMVVVTKDGFGKKPE